MKCGLEYCIYNRDSLCILENIEINSLGMCEGCIILAPDRDYLDVEKERQMRELESRWIGREKE